MMSNIVVFQLCSFRGPGNRATVMCGERYPRKNIDRALTQVVRLFVGLRITRIELKDGSYDRRPQPQLVDFVDANTAAEPWIKAVPSHSDQGASARMRVVSAIIGTPAPGWCRMGFLMGTESQ